MPAVAVNTLRGAPAVRVMLLGVVALLHGFGAQAAPFAYLPRLGSDTVAVVDLQTRSVVANPVLGAGGTAYSVAASRSTGKVFVGLQISSIGKQVARLDVTTHTVDRLYSLGGGVNVIAVSPDGGRLYAVMYNDARVKVLDVASGAVVSTIPILDSTMGNGIAVSPDGSKVLVVHTNSARISVIDTASNTVVHTIGSRDNPFGVAFSPDGSRAYVTLWGSNQLQVIDMLTYADGSIQVGGAPIGVAVSPDGTRVYTVNSGANTVSVIDGTTNAWLMNIGLGGTSQPLGISTTVDGSAVYVTRAGNTHDALRIDTATHAVTDTIAIGGSPFAVGIFTTGTTVPSPPVLTGVTGDIGTATVAFTPSTNDGGQPILQYTVSCGSASATTLTSPVLFSGLTNGLSLACKAYATNAVGNSVLSNIINVIPGRIPGAPTITATMAGDRQVTVHFDPPASNGGAAISNYRAYCTGPAGTNSTSTAGSPITVASLVNGTSYQCVVRGFNSIGQGDLSAAVKAVPRGVPAAPSILQTAGENHAAYLRFQAPAANGSAITGYIGRCTGGFTVSVGAASSELRITGLTNGQTYGCRVHAVNDVGESPASTSHDIVPAGPPDPPTLDSASAGNASATLVFSAPAFTNGAAITGYQASCNGILLEGPASPIAMTGLSNGTDYSCSVRAINLGGLSIASNILHVTPATTPTAPALTWVQEEAGLLRLHVQAPASNGGAAITGYVGDCSGIIDSNSVSPVVIDGLSNGTSYSCTVRARNSVGDGLPSEALSGTPRTVPGAPLIGTATPGDQQATVQFAPPLDDGGADISQYTLGCSPGVPSIVGAVSPQAVTGLSNGTVYRCSVRARNVAGEGAPSAQVSVIPGTGLNVANLSIAKTNNLVFLNGGLRTGYRITVHNPGPAHVAHVRVIDALESYFSETAWTCSGNGGAICAAGGQGDLDTLVDMPAGASVVIDIDAVLAAFPEDPVSNVAAIEVPDSVSDPDLANNVASDGPDIRGIFRDEFE